MTIAYGTVTDPFGTPVPAAALAITAVNTAVPESARRPVGVGQCTGAGPVVARVTTGADGRFVRRLEYASAARPLLCLSIQVEPPRGSGLESLELALDSVVVKPGASAVPPDSVRMDIIVSPGAEPVAAPAEVVLSPPPSFASADEELAYLAGIVPGGFGGYYLQDGTTCVYLTDLDRAAEAQAVLRAYFRLRPPPAGVDPGRLRFAHGRYDYVQLRDWRERLASGLGRAAEVRIRMDWNKLQVGVATAAAATRARAVAKRLGVPSAALLVVGRR